jgi:TolB-like protein/DNA-binding winged helix-turn-helix (wHTH) protein
VLATADIFLFEEFRLDRQGEGLSRRDQRGVFVPVSIGVRALDVLGVLVQRAGQLVSKEHIITAVWGRTVVENANLTVQISALRRVLDEGRTEGSCIQTVAARGYRFVAPVTRVEHADAASTAGDGQEDTGVTRRLVAVLAAETVVGLPAVSVPRVVTPRRGRVGPAVVSAAAAAALVVVAGVAWWVWPAPRSPMASAPAVSTPQPAPRLSIVVLPFANLGSDPDQQYFADGIAEDVTTDLSRISGMFVISRNSAFTYRNKLVETRQIGRELGVRYALEGGVQRSGNQVRVNAQLIDAETGAHLWAERFDRDIGDLFALQSEITSRIAIALNLELIRAEAARPTDNPNAMDYILKGRAAFAKGYTRESAAEAIPLFERALALDPRSVEAQSRLALALVYRAFFAALEAARTDHERAEVLIGEALASSPEYPLAHLARGNLLTQQRLCEDAIPEFQKVLAIDRNEVGAAAALGFCKFLTGGSDAETMELEEQAIRLSPRDPSIAYRYYNIGAIHLFQSRTDEAILWLEKARRADAMNAGPRYFLASAYGLKGESDRAAAELAEAERLTRSDKYSTIARVKANGVLNTPATRDRFEGIFLVGLRKAGLPEE